jgi:hypothetical protein
MNKQFKPVLVKIMTGSAIEEVRAFDTLKLVYSEYAGQLTVCDYHSFRGLLYPKSKGRPYNVMSFKHIQDKLQLTALEWITPEEAMSLLKDKTHVEALKEKNFFEFRGNYGHLVNKSKPKVEEPKESKIAPDAIEEVPLESPSTQAPEPVEVIVDVETNKASFEKAFKSLRNIFHSKHVGYATIKNRFEANNLPGFPDEITDEIREIAFLAWASDKTPSPEQTALLGFKE